MTQIFDTNTRFTRIKDITVANLFMFLFGMYYMTFLGENFPVWWFIVFGAVILLLLLIFRKEYLFPNKIEIKDSYILFHYPFTKSKKYNFSEVDFYATASCGARSGHFHGLVLSFSDNYRTLVTDRSVNNYKLFLDWVNNSNFENYGYIGGNNWQQRRKPISKKWAQPDYEKELIKELGTSYGLVYYYIAAVLSFSMNLLILYLLFFEL